MKKQYGDRLIVVAIAIESEEADVRAIAKEMNIPLRWAMGTPEIARKFGDIASVPTLFLFRPDGIADAVFYGAPPELHASAEKAIASAVPN